MADADDEEDVDTESEEVSAGLSEELRGMETLKRRRLGREIEEGQERLRGDEVRKGERKAGVEEEGEERREGFMALPLEEWRFGNGVGFCGAVGFKEKEEEEEEEKKIERKRVIDNRIEQRQTSGRHEKMEFS